MAQVAHCALQRRPVIQQPFVHIPTSFGQKTNRFRIQRAGSAHATRMHSELANLEEHITVSECCAIHNSYHSYSLSYFTIVIMDSHHYQLTHLPNPDPNPENVLFVLGSDLPFCSSTTAFSCSRNSSALEPNPPHPSNSSAIFTAALR